MKYSIIANQLVPSLPFKTQSTFNKLFSDYRNTFLVSINQKNALRLQQLLSSKNEAEQESLVRQTDKKADTLEVSLAEQLDWKLLKLAWGEGDAWTLVFQRPLRIYFVLGKYKAMVPIKLEKELDLDEMSCYIKFPDLFIYGHSAGAFKNSLYTINLQTFQTKETISGKDYSPKNRSQAWSFFSDSRLYVASGFDKHQKQIDSLMWTLNIDNGYWFALDLVQQNTNLAGTRFSCEFENGKVLAIGKKSVSVVELYQSQVKELQGWKEIIQPQTLQQVQSVFIWQEWIYLLVKGEIFPKRFKINKIKTAN